MKTFLINLGFSGFEADRLISRFGDSVLSFFDTAEGRNKLSGVIERSSIKAAHIQYCRIWSAPMVFRLLESFGIPETKVYEYYLLCGEKEDSCLAALKDDPYDLVFSVGAPFSSVDDAASFFAESEGYTLDTDMRTEAAVYSVLLLAENGNDETGKGPFSELISEVAGSTCLPLGKLTLLCQMMVDDLSSDATLDAAKRLHRKRQILLTRKTVGGKSALYAYTESMAEKEFGAAGLVRSRLSSCPVRYDSNLYSVIDGAQAALDLYLSHEQVEAVHRSLTSRISVITGGPGTGKTATQKVLLESFRRLSRNGRILLMAPTGQAAKNMTKATGHSAQTMHLALGINPERPDDSASAKDLHADLIVVDEASMIDATMFYHLLKHTPDEALLVIVGDPDQLPSIGAGNVLSELIRSVPVSKLTKVFRQGSDSDIAYNASRIRAGSSQMIESDRFSFIEANSSAEIQKRVCSLYKEVYEAAGPENVIVLSPLRRKGKTGVNQLNIALRKVVSDSKHYVSYDNIRIYEGDKIVFLKNRLGLVNGDIGFVKRVHRNTAVCIFGDKKITLSGSQLSCIAPAFAETIHKSQGDEYRTVILVADKSHRMSRPMAYTAITRSRDRIYIVGTKDAFSDAINTAASERYSCLSALI